MSEGSLVVVIDLSEALNLMLDGERFISDLQFMSQRGLRFMMTAEEAESLGVEVGKLEGDVGDIAEEAYDLFLEILTVVSSPKDADRVLGIPPADMLITLARKHHARWIVSSVRELQNLQEIEGIILGDGRKLYAHLAAKQPLVLIARLESEQEANLLRYALEEEGIRPLIKAQEIPWYDGVLAFAEGYYGDLYVLEKDRERAQIIVDEVRRGFQDEEGEGEED